MKEFLISPVKLAIVIGAVVALAGCRTEPPSPPDDPEAIAAGRELLAVLETGEPEQLKHYLATQTNLLDLTSLSEDALGFFYDGEWIRQYDPQGRSIVEIIALDDIEILAPLQPDGSVILEFVPKRYLHAIYEMPEPVFETREWMRNEIYEMPEPGFETSEWMRKYFACWFKKVDGRWQLWMNLCFAESDGPFPLDMGV